LENKVKKHSTQHRQQSEEKERVKKLRELRQENQSLRKQVSRLQKQVQKLVQESIPEPDGSLADTTSVQRKCPECGSVKIHVLHLPMGALNVCKDCGWRGKWK
jgi:predicted RNA-binding Zn-ribbon protein involved in translation (DUF1610 family)